MSLRLAVFASGSGTNLQSLIDVFQTGADHATRIALVVSDREQAGALDRARAARIETVVVPVSGRPADYVARELLAALHSADIDLILLAGYLRLIPPAVVRHYRQRILNIHPALLPAFGGRGMYGLRVHAAVLAAGVTVTGATVHLVNELYDEGEILAQWPVPVLPDDSAQTLANRVLRVEHLLYPAVVEAAARILERGGTLARPAHALSAAAFTFSRADQPDASAIRLALGLD